MTLEPRKMVPPDGGWGWIVVLGVSLVNLCTRSIEPSFGLLFGDILAELGVQTTGAAFIMSTLDALINFSGLFVGPLIRHYSCRKVSIVGSILCFLGLVSTFPANSVTHILITYSIINGLGVGLTASSTFVALNHYFVKKRGQAVGYSLAGTALGMMLMPQAVRLLLEEYNFRGAILLIGAWALNSLVGSALLQPAKWHFIPESKTEAQEAAEAKHLKEMTTIKEDEDEQEVTLMVPNLAKDLESNRPGSLPNLIPKPTAYPRNVSTASFVHHRRRRESSESIVSDFSRLDFTGSTLQIHIKSDGERRRSSIARRKGSFDLQNLHTSFHKYPDLAANQAKAKQSVWHKIVAFMDLELLTDPIYLNLLFGLSVFYVAEQNFKMVTPFFLAAIGYDKTNQALFLSIQSLSDILARLILPPICDRLQVTKRTLFMVSIFFLGISRSIMAEQTSFTVIMVWIIICGFCRGAAFINFSITISEYSTLEKLPAAFGLHMVGKGLFVVSLGPVLGVIRDTTKSYPICLHSQTFLMMLCVLAWSIEFLIIWLRARKRGKDTDSDVTVAR